MASCSAHDDVDAAAVGLHKGRLVAELARQPERVEQELVRHVAHVAVDVLRRLPITRLLRIFNGAVVVEYWTPEGPLRNLLRVLGLGAGRVVSMALRSGRASSARPRAARRHDGLFGKLCQAGLDHFGRAAAARRSTCSPLGGCGRGAWPGKDFAGVAAACSLYRWSSRWRLPAGARPPDPRRCPHSDMLCISLRSRAVDPGRRPARRRARSRPNAWNRGDRCTVAGRTVMPRCVVDPAIRHHDFCFWRVHAESVVAFVVDFHSASFRLAVVQSAWDTLPATGNLW